jgi:hypothetical protein
MNRRFGLLIASVLLLASSLACRLSTSDIGISRTTVRGSGNVVEEVRSIRGVDAVQLSTLGQLEIEIGDSPELRIEGESNIVNAIRTDVRNGLLHIRTDPGTNLRPTEPVRYYLRVESLERIELASSGGASAPALASSTFTIRLSSSGNLEVESLTCDTCDINLSSSGNTRIRELEADRLNIRISSSGDLTIDGGEITRQEITLSSSGNYNAGSVRSSQTEVRVSSSGSARVWVDDELRGRISSSGNVIYRGNPEVDVSTSSSGRVRGE